MSPAANQHSRSGRRYEGGSGCIAFASFLVDHAGMSLRQFVVDGCHFRRCAAARIREGLGELLVTTVVVVVAIV